jgi:hypothetical protein
LDDWLSAHFQLAAKQNRELNHFTMTIRASSGVIARSLLCFGILAKSAQGQQTSESLTPGIADWRHDLDAIASDVVLLHPNPFKKISRLDFLREIDALMKQLPALTDEQRLVKAMKVVASIGDGHTQLEPTTATFAYWYPIRLYEFTDGLFVTSAHKSVADLAGAQVLEIGGKSWQQVILRARRLMGADNQFGSMERLFALHSAALMKGLGYAGTRGQLTFTFKLRNGKTVERTLQPSKSTDATFEWRFRREMFGLPFGSDSDWVSAYNDLPASAYETMDTLRPAHLIDGRQYLARSIPASEAYYMRADGLDDNFVAFIKTSLRAVDTLKPRRLLIDLRYNVGGDGSTVTAAIHEFIKREDTSPWKELYLLTSRRTFSAGVMLVDAFLDNVPVTIVGEPPGAPLNSFGDATTRNYPRTGLRLHVSTLWHQLGESNDLRTYIPVDIPARFSSTDYEAGSDPAVDPILAGGEMRGIPVIAAIQGGDAARAVYLDRKSRFAKYEWWVPPQEIELRRVCQHQREEHRVEAVQTCRLNTEINPHTWSAWLNYGQALRRGGDRAAGLGSYKCVLLIDPNNFEGDAIKQLIAKEDPSGTVPVAKGCPMH